MSEGVNLDRGVIIRTHSSGMDVYMYADTPGAYLNAFGKSVSSEIASQAGYDVVRLGKERVKRERIEAARIAIENELDLGNEEQEGELNVVKEEGDYKVVDIGLGRFHLYDVDDNKLTPSPLTEADVNTLLKALNQDPDEQGEPVEPDEVDPDEGGPEFETEVVTADDVLEVSASDFVNPVSPVVTKRKE